MPELPRPVLLDGSFHAHLLHDKRRLDAFAQAIRATVREGDVVADLGSGSGVLAHLCAKAGAAKVHAVEMNTYSHGALVRNVLENGWAGRIVPTLADATQWGPHEPVDVVVCELMETGLLHEPIVAIMRHIRETWPHPPRAFIPHAVSLLVDAVTLDDVFHGYRAVYPGFRADEGTSGRALTDAASYAEMDFTRGPLPEGVDAAFALRAQTDGRIDALRLRTRTHLAPGVTHESSPAYCTPVILPLENPLAVRAGDALRGALAYDFAYTHEPLRYDLSP